MKMVTCEVRQCDLVRKMYFRSYFVGIAKVKVVMHASACSLHAAVKALKNLKRSSIVL